MSIIRLDKYVADSSSLTRKESAKAIKGGNVTVNGNNVNDISYKINTDSDKVTLFNKPLIYKENYYIMMNKPQGYLSVTEDKKDKTVMELLSEDLPKEKLFPAGRLDKDTEGFLFITTDGPMAHKITGPKNHVKKKYYVETDRLDAEGIPITDYYLNPKKSATRFEIADVINRALENLQIYPSQMAVEFGFDKIMPVIDGSTSTLPFTHAVYSSLFEGGYFHPQRPEKHSKSHQSYERLINGEIDMMFASVYPAQDILKLAEEKGVELELIPIAYDAMIFFTNADNPATDLTKEQISDIYVNNAYESWSELGGPDALLYPYCRNNDSGSHAQMERHFLNGNEINEQIRNETTSVTMANVLTDVMSAQTDEPVGYGLGYSIYYYFHNMDMFYGTSTELKLLAIDGVFPTDETIANGTYPLSNNTYVVIRKDQPADSPARKMAQFMLTEQGQECVEAAGFGRLK